MFSYLFSYFSPTTLQEACSLNRTTRVSSFLNREDIDVNERDDTNDGNTPLMIACQKGYFRVVELLLADKRINVNLENNHGVTAFYLACLNGETRTIQTMLNDKRVDGNKGTKHRGLTPLIVACIDDHEKTSVIELLLSSKRINVNLSNTDGWTALYYACQNCLTEIVVLLLKSPRIDVNKPGPYGTTPLMIACEYGHLQIVKYLLEDPRINVNLENDYGETAFYIACFDRRTEIVKLMIMDRRVNINQENKERNTPFMCLCAWGKIEIVKLMLASRKELLFNHKNSKEKTGLEIAKERSNEKWSNQNCFHLVKLLEGFEKDPEGTRNDLIKELRLSGILFNFIFIFLFIDFYFIFLFVK